MVRTPSKRCPAPYYRSGRGWYGDFRRYAEVGGRQHEALIPYGCHQRTRTKRPGRAPSPCASMPSPAASRATRVRVHVVCTVISGPPAGA